MQERDCGAERQFQVLGEDATPAERMRLTREGASECIACDLWLTRQHVAFGEGSPTAALMLVGEGPGRQEDQQGRPFVGRAGQLLNELLTDAGIARADLWITNIVKCRPAVRQPSGTMKDRPPRVGEITACHPWLKAEIGIARPRVILCLGASAAKSVIGPGFRLREQRGHWFTADPRRWLLATFHPAYLLRLRNINPGAFAEARAQVLSDLRQAWSRATAEP